MGETSIAWCDAVWNPVTGCRKVSEGCRHCYAESIAKRFWGGRKFTDVQYHPERLDQPLRWKKPRRIFVNSMSDLFHEDVSFDFILKVWMTMAAAKQHTFIVLTKRPDQMRLFVNEWLPGAWGLATMSMRLLDAPLPNVWLGVSAETQAAADERIPYLLSTPAAVRFVSVEPMLEEIDIFDYLNGCPVKVSDRQYITRDMARDAGVIELEGLLLSDEAWVRTTSPLDWVICGCESGAGARPFDMDWARSLRDQCQAADVPFFFKQAMVNGRLVDMPALDGVVYSQWPKEGTQA